MRVILQVINRYGKEIVYILVNEEKHELVRKISGRDLTEEHPKKELDEVFALLGGPKPDSPKVKISPELGQKTGFPADCNEFHVFFYD